MDRLRNHVSSLEVKWEVLKKKQTLLSLHRAVSRQDGAMPSSTKKRESLRITDMKDLNFDIDEEFEQDREVICDILVAWETLLYIVRDIQLVILTADFSKLPQQRKRIKTDFRHFQEIVDRKRCDKTHPELKAVMAKVPLDVRGCKWTKVLSLVPKGLDYAHRILSVINTHFPDLQERSQLAASLSLLGDRPHSDKVTRSESSSNLDFPPVVTVRRSFSTPGLRPIIHQRNRAHHFSHSGVPSVGSSVININFPSHSDPFFSNLKAHGHLDEMEERMAVFDLQMEDAKHRIEMLEFHLRDCRNSLTNLEIEARLKDFHLKETMKEVQRLGGSKLRPPLTDCQMEDIAACLRDDFHIRLANILDIDLTEIEHDYPIVTCGLREVKVQILRRWREREGEGGTVERLIMGMMKGESLAGTAKDILDNLLGNN